jgi:hypothetical protein
MRTGWAKYLYTVLVAFALKNANLSIDIDDGAVWLWVTDGNEHAGIDLSAQMPDPSMDEVVKQWARRQEKINV